MADGVRSDFLLPALTIARMIREGEASCAEVLEAHLQHIAASNARLGAIVQLAADRARETAARWDRAIARGNPSPPLAGVPFTVKDGSR